MYTKSSCCILGLQSSYKAALLVDKTQYFLYHRICMRKESSSQRWETRLFLSAYNMSAVTSVKSALAYAIRVKTPLLCRQQCDIKIFANICARGNILTIKFRTSEIIAE